MMSVKNILKPFLFLGGILLVSACSANKAQSDFRQEAIAPPNGFTEMTVHGTPVEDGQKDPTDWRTAPEFIGLIQVEPPAFPNPIFQSQRLKINLYITGSNQVSNLFVYVLRPQSNALLGPLDVTVTGGHSGFTTLALSPASFAQTGVGSSGLYRLLIFDDRNQIITYGDVKVK